MAKQMITTLLKTVSPYLKAEAGIPPWLLPERSVNQVVDAVGDSGFLRIGRPLGTVAPVDSAPDLASVSPQEWHNAIREWRPLPQLGPMMTAFVEVAEPIMAQFAKVRPAIDPLVICRSLAVLLYAPLVDQGKVVSEELAGVLGEQASQPTRLVMSYAKAVVRGDIPTVEKVHQCILKYSDWREWALALQKEVLRCRLRPKLIAVTPLLSTELTSVLATMLKEVYDESRGDHSAHSGDQILAQ